MGNKSSNEYISHSHNEKIQIFLNKYHNFLHENTIKLLEYNKKNINKGNFISRTVKNAVSNTSNIKLNIHYQNVYDTIFYYTIKKTTILLSLPNEIFVKSIDILLSENTKNKYFSKIVFEFQTIIDKYT